MDRRAWQVRQIRARPVALEGIVLLPPVDNLILAFQVDKRYLSQLILGRLTPEFD